MSRSLNRVTLIGNVGQHPELRATQNGSRVATFSLATSRSWKGPNGDRQEKTEWHRCVAWNYGKGQGLADVVEKYVNKGDKLYVEGRVEYRQWEDKGGVKRITTEINVSELLMLGANGEPREKTGSRKSAAMSKNDSNDFDDFPDAMQDDEDDLPF